MKPFEHIWGVITGSDQSPQSAPQSSQETATTSEKPVSKIDLVPDESSDPYQDHTHQPHCSDHFLFTKDCALCQEIKQAQHPKPHHTRSFGFTDSLTSASLTPHPVNLGPSANAALQSLPAMILNAEAPYRTIAESIAVNTLVNEVVDTVAELEIDSLRND